MTASRRGWALSPRGVWHECGRALNLVPMSTHIDLSVALGLVTANEEDPDRGHESQTEAPTPSAETPTRFQRAAAGMAEAQAWKGQQIAKGWQKLVSALRRTGSQRGR